MITSCGIFLYDSINKKILCTKAYGSRFREFLSIPKGLFEEEDGDFLTAAIREFREETSIDLYSLFENGESIIENKTLFPLGSSEYKKGGKQLNSHLLITDTDLSDYPCICESFFTKDGKEFPEISEFHWLTLSDAENFLHPTQSIHIPKITKLLANYGK